MDNGAPMSPVLNCVVGLSAEDARPVKGDVRGGGGKQMRPGDRWEDNILF